MLAKPTLLSAPAQASHNPMASAWAHVGVWLSAAQMKTAKGVNKWTFFSLFYKALR